MSLDSLHIFAASGVELRLAAVQRARRRLGGLGFDVTVDPSVRARSQRFAGNDAQRVETLHRLAGLRPSIALAARGGYGMTRLLDTIDWDLLGESICAGTRWVGYSDMTPLQLGLLAHGGHRSWHGPMATEDFGRVDDDDAETKEANEVTVDCFVEAMSGVLEAVGFRTDAGRGGLKTEGTLWGGNLAMVVSLLGTRHWPHIDGGILFLEDVAEHPYRIERLLLQLQQSGVLDRQRAVLLGQFSDWKPSPIDRGYTLKSALAAVQARTATPLLTGLPFGHGPLKVCLPQGAHASLEVWGRDALLHWGDT